MSRLWSRIRSWFATEIVSDVPEDNSVCEFDCGKLECREEDWQNCGRRIHGKVQPGKLTTGKLPNAESESE